MGESKKKRRIDSKNESPPGQRIQSRSNQDVLKELLCFSFKFYDLGHSKFQCKDRDQDYFQKLLSRVKELSREQIISLTQTKPNSATRFHRIDFRDPRVSEDGFGIAQWEQYDEDAWQFSLSSNEHGRVHGFLIMNVFYVVWLDPDHRLYPGV